MNSSGVNSSKVIIYEYANLMRENEGWVLVNVTDDGAQFSIPKSFDWVIFIIGILTSWIYGLGLIFMAVAALAYIFDRESTFFISTEEMTIELEKEKER